MPVQIQPSQGWEILLSYKGVAFLTKKAKLYKDFIKISAFLIQTYSTDLYNTDNNIHLLYTLTSSR